MAKQGWLPCRPRPVGSGWASLVDIVPNHVGVAAPEPGTWWWDLLQHGPESAHARAFDVDWDASDGRVVIPVVGDDDVRDDGAIDHLELVDGELRYHDHRFPIAPETAEPGDDADVVHARQHYRLALWREADSGLNYRRFFAVNTLAAIRVEDPDGLRRLARRDPPLVRRGSGRRAPRRPP